jgi:hypothetical protein
MNMALSLFALSLCSGREESTAMSTAVIKAEEPPAYLGEMVEEPPVPEESDADEDYKNTFLNFSADEEEPEEIAVGAAWSDVCGLMPSISVEGFGLIGLPLTEPEARRLREVGPLANIHISKYYFPWVHTRDIHKCSLARMTRVVLPCGGFR